MASIAAPSYAKSLTVSDGTKYGYIYIPAQTGKPSLLWLHGYPSSSYHWHNQVQQCIDAGYGMIAPDLLGYGDTSKPTEISAYDNTIIAKQVVEILDEENLPVVVGIGHDWGSVFLSTLVRTYPKRFSQLIFMAVGYAPSQAALTDIDAINANTEAIVGWPIFGYWYFHNKPEAASVMENADPASIASLLFPADPKIWIANLCKPGGIEAWIKEKKVTELAPWIKPAELETHGSILASGGMTGPLNWYKQAMAGVTHASETKINPNYAATKITIPTLFVSCGNDMVARPALQEAGMKGSFTDLTVKSLDTSHWIMLEKPKELWEILHGWIEEASKKA